MDKGKRYVVGITGASGAIYGLELVQKLLTEDNKVFCAVSKSAKEIVNQEIDLREYPFFKMSAEEDFLSNSPNLRVFDENDFFAPIASGSFYFDAMAISPCSMKTLGKIANSIADNIIIRAAEVALKERRRLVLVTRETPLALTHLKNMLSASEAGAIILPACPAFYNSPKSISDLTDFITARTLSTMGIRQNLIEEWGNE